jgi:uncharacterized protein (TIGR02118 family)
MTVLYNKPTDSKHFQEYYFATHVPITKRIPGLRSFVVSDGVVLGPDGSPAQHELVAQLTFDSQEHLQKALGSSEGQAAVGDLKNFATGGVTIVVFETREI